MYMYIVVIFSFWFKFKLLNSLFEQQWTNSIVLLVRSESWYCYLFSGYFPWITFALVVYYLYLDELSQHFISELLLFCSCISYTGSYRICAHW